MKNTQYVLVEAGSVEKLVDQINSQLKEAISMRMCGGPIRVVEKDESVTWYQGLIVVTE